MGGYVSFPVASLAVALRYRVALCEQNSIPGTTNKILGRFVNAFFASFDITKNYIQGKHIIISGNPLRSSLLEKRNEAGDKQENKQEHTFTILIIGGSQGSRNINEAVVAILPYILKENGINIRIMHQTGYEDYEWVKHSYEQTGTCGSVVPFIDDMGSAYIFADLIVSRAGATVISEILFFGKPSILIPHPFSAKNHQEHNADILVKSGAAIKIIDFPENRELLAQKIVTLIHDKARLQEMGKRAHLLAKPDATKTIVNWCFEKGNGETDV